MKIKESLDNALDYQLQEDHYEKTVYTFSLKQSFDLDLDINVKFVFLSQKTYGVDFFSFGMDKNLSSQKKASFAIFATLVEILNEFVKNKNIMQLLAQADLQKKADIYEKLFKRFGEGWEVTRSNNTFYVKRVENNENN